MGLFGSLWIGLPVKDPDAIEPADCPRLKDLLARGAQCVVECDLRLRGLLERMNASGAYRDKLSELSMGMSSDFEAAILEGATLVRVGTTLFGERPRK